MQRMVRFLLDLKSLMNPILIEQSKMQNKYYGYIAAVVSVPLYTEIISVNSNCCSPLSNNNKKQKGN